MRTVVWVETLMPARFTRSTSSNGTDPQKSISRASSAATRVESSDISRKVMPVSFGLLPQYLSFAVVYTRLFATNCTSLYGPLPMGFCAKAAKSVLSRGMMCDR